MVKLWLGKDNNFYARIDQDEVSVGELMLFEDRHYEDRINAWIVPFEKNKKSLGLLCLRNQRKEEIRQMQEAEHLVEVYSPGLPQIEFLKVEELAELEKE